MGDRTWPYGDPVIAATAGDISWSCPTGICECGDREEHEPFEFSVMLCTHESERMPFARARVWVNGVVRNAALEANHEGWMSVVVPHDVDSVFVEWAPAHLPVEWPYPYRKRFFVSLGLHETGVDADVRRLHNLGFNRRPTLRENVEDFQIEYGYADVTGELDDIREDLRSSHDDGSPLVRRRELPVTPTVDEDEPFPPPDDQVRPEPPGDDILVAEPHGTRDRVRLVGFVDGEPAAPATAPLDAPERPAPPGPPPTQGLQKAGAGKGTVRHDVGIPDILDVIHRKKHRFQWTRIYAEIDDGGVVVGGFFWVFRDALTTEATLRTRSGSTVSSRTINLRVPCTAAETFKAATLIRAKGSDLPFPPNGVSQPPSTALDSLPLTSKASDIRYVGAQTQITPCSGYMNKRIVVRHASGKKTIKRVPIPIEIGTAKHHLCIEKKLTAVAGSTKPSAVGWMADPGKIWVLTTDSNTTAVNYGWHVPAGEVTKKSTKKPLWRGTRAFRAISRPPYSGPALGTQELWVLQSEGRRHGKGHEDYSQVLLLIEHEGCVESRHRRCGQ